MLQQTKYWIKAIALLCVIQFGSTVVFAQDKIEMRDGSTIDGKVVEITETTIKYRRADQPEGPLRNVAISEVSLISYADGTKERFVLVGENPSAREPEPVNENPQVVKRRGPDRIPVDKDRILCSGFWMDFMVGYCGVNYVSSVSPYGGLGLRAGNKWYFGNGERYRPGIQATWLRFGVYSSSIYPSDIDRGYISPLNLGFTNAFRFGEKTGMELNVSGGPVLLDWPPESNGDVDMLIGIEAKYRYGRFALGLDYARVGLFDFMTPMDVLSLSVGLKF